MRDKSGAIHEVDPGFSSSCVACLKSQTKMSARLSQEGGVLESQGHHTGKGTVG